MVYRPREQEEYALRRLRENRSWLKNGLDGWCVEGRLEGRGMNGFFR